MGFEQLILSRTRVFYTHFRYQAHKLEPVLTTTMSDGVCVALCWVLPTFIAVIASATSSRDDWNNDGVCWPKTDLFWAAFAWPSIAASLVSFGLLIITAMSPGIAIAESGGGSRIMPGSWDRDSGALPTMLHNGFHVLTWVLVAAGAYQRNGEAFLVFAAAAAMLQGFITAMHQFFVRGDGRSGCAAVMMCTAAPPSDDDSADCDPHNYWVRVPVHCGKNQCTRFRRA